MGRSGECLEHEGHALPTADTQRHHATHEAVAAHGMKNPCREHRPGGADRVPMRDCAALDIDHLVGKTELARACDRNSGERFIDFDAIDVADLPAGAPDGLAHCRYRRDAEHAWLDRRDAIRDEPCKGVRPRCSAHAASATISAAAPLLSPGALPAVIVPPLLKAGLSRANDSSVVFRAIVLVRLDVH